MRTYQKMHKGLVVVLATLCTVFFLMGCQQGPAAPSKPGEEVIKDGIKKLTEITSANYEIALKGDVQDKEAGDMKFDVALSGIADMKDQKDPKITLKLVGSGSQGTEVNGAASMEVRLNKDALFFNVLKLEVGQELPADLKAMMAKWWKFTIPEDSKAELFKSIPQGGTQENLTPEQQQMKKLVEETNFISKPEFKDMQDVKGESSYHYSVTLDNQATIEFVKKAAALQGEMPTDTEMAELKTFLDKVSVTGDLYVGSVSGVLNKFNGTIKMDKAGPTESTGSVSVNFVLGGINQAMTLEVPAGAEEFPAEQVFGALMGGVPTTDTSYDTTGSLDLTGVEMTDTGV